MPRPRRWSPDDQDDPRLRRNMNSGLGGGLIQSITGPLASPRANPNFDPKTAVDTGEQPYKKAGFFRRLIGDQSDLMNREFQQNRMGLLIDRNEMDLDRAKDFETFSKQQQLQDQLAKDRIMLEAGQNSVDAISQGEMQHQNALQRQKLMIDAERFNDEARAGNALNNARLGYDADMMKLQQAGQIANAELRQRAQQPIILNRGDLSVNPDGSGYYNEPPVEGGAISASTGMSTPYIPGGRRRLPPTAGDKLDDTDRALIQSVTGGAGAGQQQRSTLVNPVVPQQQVPAALAPQGPAYSQPTLVPEYSQGADVLRTLINKYAAPVPQQQPYQPNAIDLGTLLQRKEEEARRRMQRVY